jgi:SAM-dependent methyltransferase
MFDGAYLDWNQKRIKGIVDYYGHQFFVHKKVLDLGCGYGDISGVLHRLGSDITAVDARQEHLKIIGKKYVGVKTVKSDLDKPWPFFGKTFDLTLDLAVICYLNNFEEHLKSVCASTNFLIVETPVLDSPDPNACNIYPDKNNSYDGSFNGFNSQISSANVERVLRNCGMTFKRMDNAKFNSGPYVYDWQSKNDNSYSINKRRIWFCSKGDVQIPTADNTINISNVGASSPHLLDSKVPIKHQHMVITRSPSPPGGPRMVIPPPSYSLPRKPGQTVPINPGFTPYVDTSGTLGKVRLFYNYYVNSKNNSDRQKELEYCLQKNLSSTIFDLIIVESETNPTYDFMFQKINRLAKDNDISIICHSDIYFDDTIKFINQLRHKEVYALTRWMKLRDNSITLDDNHQNVWAVRGKVEGVKGNFPMGLPGSDGRIAYEFETAGYKVSNPAKLIKTFHYHASGIRHYTDQDRVGPADRYLYIKPEVR